MSSHADHHLFPSPRAWQRGASNANIVLQLGDPATDLMSGTRMPELLSPLRTLELVEKFRSQYNVDFTLPSLLRSKLGYYLFKSALEVTDGGAHLLSFVEDVIAFRLCSSPYARHQAYVIAHGTYGWSKACCVRGERALTAACRRRVVSFHRWVTRRRCHIAVDDWTVHRFTRTTLTRC